MALGVEHFEAVDLLAGAGELDRRAGDLPHRKCRAAARVAVGLGEDDAGQRQRFLERLRGVDRILALHRVDDEQRLDRLQRRMQVGDLFHQRFVDREAPGGVDEQHVEVVALRMVERGVGDRDRLIAGMGGEPLRAGLLCHRLQLLDRGGPVDVGRHRQHFLLALFDQVLGELRGRRRLAGALQAGHQDHRRRLRGEVDVGHARAHRRCQLAIDDAHQRLARRQRADHFGAERLIFDAGDEVAHDRQRDVGLEQRHAHLAQHVLHIAFGDAGLSAHRLDEAAQPIGEGGCHDVCVPSVARTRRVAQGRESTLCE